MKLHHHRQSSPSSPMALAVGLRRDERSLIFSYSLSASAELVRIPSAAEPVRTDGLWHTTCFEAFIRDDCEPYVELNFSPSGQWAAYTFDSYREGMRELELSDPPEIVIHGDLGQLDLTVRIELPDEFMRPGAPTALSAVIEEVDGTKSYWALAHGDGAPDFHHPDCFAARLP